VHIIPDSIVAQSLVEEDYLDYAKEMMAKEFYADVILMYH
jgi:hypothetical protein